MNMLESTICREMKVEAGTAIWNAAEEAVKIADQYGQKVFFEFLGTHCEALPGQNATEVRAAYDKKREAAWAARQGDPEPGPGKDALSDRPGSSERTMPFDDFSRLVGG